MGYVPFGSTLLRLVTGGAGVLALGLGWVYYVAMTLWALRSKRRRNFFVIYLILCASFALNIAGCKVLGSAPFAM